MLFRATCVAFGSSQASGQIGVATPGLQPQPPTQDPSHVCSLRPPQLMATLDHYPLSEAKSSWLLAGFVTTEPQWGLPWFFFFNQSWCCFWLLSVNILYSHIFNLDIASSSLVDFKRFTVITFGVLFSCFSPTPDLLNILYPCCILGLVLMYTT